MNKEEYKNHFGRPIADDEIVVEFDWPCPDPEFAVKQTGYNLHRADYCFEVWKAEGMFSEHIHIKGIRQLGQLSKEVRRKYREVFLEKYAPGYYYPFADVSLCCDKHRIAEEYKPHFKYGTVKKPIALVNSDAINCIEEHLCKRAEIQLQKELYAKRHYPPNTGDENIIKIAEDYGLVVIGNNTTCPFHNDIKPSLFFEEKKGLFHCFGCQVGGNVAKFKELLEEKKNAL